MKNTTVKKLLAMLLSIVMILAIVGCKKEPAPDAGQTTQAPSQGDKTTDAPKATDAPKTTDAPAVTEEPTPEPEPEPEYDFGGRVFRIGSYYDMTPNPDEGALEAALADRIAEVEEKYNCTIEFLNLGGDYVAEYVTSVLAGDPVCDIGYVV
ncbi:MAG: hypothetical protein J6X17_08855, partial [Lachnospiraceae bacterium]|nr:hypothetical protein [Lachnospiraceae bacterium]